MTGEPGAGKTYVVNRYTQWLRARSIEPAITASTGIAATHIGGQTLHSWSGVGIKRELNDWDLEALLERAPLVRRARATNVLIVDEVSMLDAHLLGLVDRALRVLRNSPRAFGGMQVVFVGDFFQLPPVSKGQQSEFAFASPAWESANPVVCYLSEQHRQEDDAFLGLLSAMRAGEFDEAHYELLRARAQVPTKLVTQLYPHNADVDRINDEALAGINEPAHTFAMQVEGSKPLVEALKRGCLSPETLTLKVGAVVMFTRNNFDEGYVNGTLGRIESFTPEGLPAVRLTFQTGAGDLIEAAAQEWRVEDGKRVLAKLVQVPLRLAWAMTVHKAQGMSLDAAAMDLSSAFEYGQGYVALSRVRTLGGLYLNGFNARSLEVHPEILEKDRALRGASEAAEVAFENMPAAELLQMQKNFVVLSGGKEPSAQAQKEQPAKVQNKLDKIRAKHPQAYRPWSREDDDKLTEMFRQSAKVSSLVKEFGRGRGAITSRLVRLGLVEPDL